MGIRNLAEAVILQSMSDLWSEGEREDCVKFFKGEGFRICADMAGMDLSSQIKLLTMVKDTVKHAAAKPAVEKTLPRLRNRGMKRINEPFSVAL